MSPRALLRVPAWALAAVGALLVVVLEPPSADLAAALYRADLVERIGLGVWNNGWYAGHHTPAYSVVFPPVAAVVGVRLTGALAAVAAAALFARLADRHWGGDRGRAAALWFAVGIVGSLLSGRLPFTLGVAVALAALLALSTGRAIAATGIALLVPLASPVAGLFLAMAAVAWGLGHAARSSPGTPGVSSRLTRPDDLHVPPARAASPDRVSRDDPSWDSEQNLRPHVLADLSQRTRPAAAIAVAALGPALALAVLFPEGGDEPFVASAFWPGLAGVVVFGLLLPARERTLRAGAALYALGWIATFAITTPLGGNVTRLGTLLAGPILVGAVAGRRATWMVVALAIPFAYWQAYPAIRDVTRASGDPSVEASYYDPLLAFLRDHGAPGDGTGTFRVEIPFTENHWEAYHAARAVPIARGWQRQLDRRYGELFYDGTLGPATYRRWLDEHAVRYVAVPDAPLDDAGEDEAALVAAGLPYLREVWAGGGWTVHAVRDPAPLLDGVPGTARLTGDAVVIDARGTGTALLRVRHTRWWRPVGGDGAACVSEAPGGLVRLRVTRPGRIVLRTRLSGDRCRDARADD